MKKTTRLRALLEAPEILVMPGAHDALSAKLAERAGFDAVIMGGFPTTGSLLAAPDSSQLGLIELADHFRRVSGAIDVPLFVDGDTGFGTSAYWDFRDQLFIACYRQDNGMLRLSWLRDGRWQSHDVALIGALTQPQTALQVGDMLWIACYSADEGGLVVFEGVVPTAG